MRDVQQQLDGREAPPERPRYDRDAEAEVMRLFEPAPTQIPGQFVLDDDQEDQ